MLLRPSECFLVTSLFVATAKKGLKGVWHIARGCPMYTRTMNESLPHPPYPIENVLQALPNKLNLDSQKPGWHADGHMNGCGGWKGCRATDMVRSRSRSSSLPEAYSRCPPMCTVLPQDLCTAALVCTASAQDLA